MNKQICNHEIKEGKYCTKRIHRNDKCWWHQHHVKVRTFGITAFVLLLSGFIAFSADVITLISYFIDDKAESTEEFTDYFDDCRYNSKDYDGCVIELKPNLCHFRIRVNNHLNMNTDIKIGAGSSFKKYDLHIRESYRNNVDFEYTYGDKDFTYFPIFEEEDSTHRIFYLSADDKNIYLTGELFDKKTGIKKGFFNENEFEAYGYSWKKDPNPIDLLFHNSNDCYTSYAVEILDDYGDVCFQLESILIDGNSSYMRFKGYYVINEVYYIYNDKQIKTMDENLADKLIKEIPKMFIHDTLDGRSFRVNQNYCQYPRIS